MKRVYLFHIPTLRESVSRLSIAGFIFASISFTIQAAPLDKILAEVKTGTSVPVPTPPTPPPATPVEVLSTGEFLTPNKIAPATLEVVEETFSTLDPSVNLDMASAVVSSNYRLHRVTQNHLAAIRGTRAEISSQAPVVSGGKEVYGKGTYGKEVAVSPGVYQMERSTNLWTTFSYDWKELEGTYRGSDYDGHDAALTVGLDFPVSDNFSLGVLVDGSRGDFDFFQGNAENENWRVAAYGTVGESTGLYVDFLVGYGNHDLNVNRRLGGALGGVNAFSDIDSDSIQALATVGYTMESGNLRHGPFLGVEYQRIHVDDFVQSGGPVPIRVAGYEAESTRGLLGYRVDTTSGNFTPYASVAYAHEFEDDGYGTAAFLPNGTPFGVFGGAQQSAVLISVGTGITLTPRLDVNIGYQGEVPVDDYGVTSHGAAIGLNFQF